MGSKLYFSDIINSEIQIGKITNAPFSTGSGSPNGVVSSSVTGSIYNDTTNNIMYLKSTGSGNTGWTQVSAASSNVYSQHYRNVNITLAVDTGTTYSPNVGDLVGIFGAGSWSASGNTNISRESAAGGGSQNATWMAGGQNTLASGLSSTELFNGATWSLSGNLNQSRALSFGTIGSQNAGLVTGGFQSNAFTSTELFNGATWSLSGNLNLSKYNLSENGSQNAALATGGANAANGSSTITEFFNGGTWTFVSNLNTVSGQASALGSQNATLIAGGTLSTGVTVSNTQLFNGSSWIYSGNLNISRGFGAGSHGSQNAGLVSGGGLTVVTGTITSTELFNGSTWSLSGNLNSSRTLAASGGSQNAGIVMGGEGSGAVALLSTELHNQTTYRKLYPRYLKTSKNIGVMTGITSATATVMIQGYNSSVTYPANMYIIANKKAICSIANEQNQTTALIVSTVAISNTASNTWIYNLESSPNLLNLVPGMFCWVSGDANAGNNGTFVISQVVTTADLVLKNTNGVTSNPSNASLTICSTLLAVTATSPQDIVLGQTDNNGFLTIPNPLIVSSVLARNR